MTNEEVLSVAEIVERATNRFNAQAVNFQERCNKYEKLMADMKAEHESEMAKQRSTMGVRIDADAQLITSLQTMVKEQSNSAKTAGDLLGWTENESPLQAVERVVKERDALRAEVADLKTQLERLTSWAAKNQAARETLQTELERLKSQTPKHPVKVGEWVRRTTAGSVAPIGKVGLVLVVWSDAYEVQLRKGFSTLWSFDDCTPCDPPTESTHDTPEGRSVAESAVKVEPKPGDVVRLVRIPSRADVSPELQTNLEWPWLERWGTLNQTAMVVKPAHQLAGAVPVCLSTNVRARWPICCVEVVRTEPDAIKVGDVVEVFRDSSGNTLKTDVGITGKVLKLYKDFIDGERLVMLDPESQNRQSEGGCHYALCDVRKVTT